MERDGRAEAVGAPAQCHHPTEMKQTITPGVRAAQEFCPELALPVSLHPVLIPGSTVDVLMPLHPLLQVLDPFPLPQEILIKAFTHWQ